MIEVMCTGTPDALCSFFELTDPDFVVHDGLTVEAYGTNLHDAQVTFFRGIGSAGAVRIGDRNEHGFLAVELRDVLRTVGNRGPALAWSIHSLEAVGDVTAVWPAGMLDLEQRILNEKDGLKIGWELLCRLAEAIDQTINCLVRGARTVGADAQTSIELEASDSSDWTITTDDQTLIDEVRSAFREVADVPP